MSKLPRTIAVIQARMSSTRLPGKVLEPIGGLPAIVFMCERLKHARLLDGLCVATSNDPSDDRLAEVVLERGLPIFRGSLNDVLDRFVSAAQQQQADVVVRLTGDCPLMDGRLVDRVIEARERGNYDYASNVAPPTFPDGLDVEVLTIGALSRAHREARLPSEREHVTPYVRQAEGFRRYCYRGPVDLSALRWTVDHPDDLAFIRALVSALPIDPIEADLFDLLRAQEAAGLRNASHIRNEGLAGSLALDKVAPPSQT